MTRVEVVTVPVVNRPATTTMPRGLPASIAPELELLDEELELEEPALEEAVPGAPASKVATGSKALMREHEGPVPTIASPIAIPVAVSVPRALRLRVLTGWRPARSTDR